MRRLGFALVPLALVAGGAVFAQSPSPGGPATVIENAKPPLTPEKQLEIKTSIARYSRGLKPGQELPRHPERLAVGTTVPGAVPLVTLPHDAFSEVPKTTTYSFVLMREGIAVVDPETRKVLQIID